MKRRDFLKSSLAIGACAFTQNPLLAKSEILRRFKVKYEFDIANDKGKYPLSLWNPLPFNSSYQKVSNLTFDGNYKTFTITDKNQYEAKTFYANWDKSSKRNTLSMQMELETTARNIPISLIKQASAKNLSLGDEVQIFLQETKHVPNRGMVKKLSDRITVGLTDRFDKAEAIYNWCTLHTYRDKNTIGCGLGDVKKMVEIGEVEYLYQNGYYGGKCTDISSLFVALTRAAQIPAREVFGIRLGKSSYSKALGKSNNNFATISEWQHCRAEYYIPGAGWIPTDPADISKLRLVEDLQYTDKRVQTLNDRYLHSWEMNWVGFNYGRDFDLFPKQNKTTLNNFGYPYAEINDKVFDYYAPKSFEYKITSQELT